MKITKRTSYTQLPEVRELEEILDREAKRDPAIGKGEKHYPKFDTVQNWLDVLNIKSKIFSSKFHWKKLLLNSLQLKQQLVEKTLKYREKNVKVFEYVTNYLGEEDEPAKSDLIFVFGSKSLYRIDKAIELWKANYSSRLYITGGHPHYEKGEPEADIFKKYAIDNGVSEKSIYTDPQSITIADNVRRSLNLFDKWNFNYDKMIMVTSWFAMRRCWAFMMKYVPEKTLIYRVVSEVGRSGDYTKESWWKNPNGINVVFNEFVKMKIGVALNTC